MEKARRAEQLSARRMEKFHHFLAQCPFDRAPPPRARTTIATNRLCLSLVCVRACLAGLTDASPLLRLTLPTHDLRFVAASFGPNGGGSDGGGDGDDDDGGAAVDHSAWVELAATVALQATSRESPAPQSGRASVVACTATVSVGLR
jgi:hypothetical protein